MRVRSVAALLASLGCLLLVSSCGTDRTTPNDQKDRLSHWVKFRAGHEFSDPTWQSLPRDRYSLIDERWFDRASTILKQNKSVQVTEPQQDAVGIHLPSDNSHWPVFLIRSLGVDGDVDACRILFDGNSVVTACHTLGSPDAIYPCFAVVRLPSAPKGVYVEYGVGK